MIFLVQKLIHLFSLYVLLTQCRSCDNNLEDCFLPISSHSRAYVSIIMEKTKGEIPPELHRETKTYQSKRSINNAACCLEIEARGKRQQNDKKCKSLNRVSSYKEKISSYQLSTKSANPAQEKLFAARLVRYAV